MKRKPLKPKRAYRRKLKINPPMAEESKTTMTPELLAGLQALANQFTVGISGTVTPNPTTPPPAEAFDVKPEAPAPVV